MAYRQLSCRLKRRRLVRRLFDSPKCAVAYDAIYAGSVVTAVAYAKISDAPFATADVIKRRFTRNLRRVPQLALPF